MRQRQNNRVRRHGRRGQATAEMVAGIVGLVVIFTGVLQISQLGDAAVANLLDARTDAMNNADNQIAQENLSIQDWEEGADGLGTTADDEVVRGNHGQINPMIVELLEPINMAPPAQRDWILSELTLGTGYAANLYRGEEERDVALEPALKRLLFITEDHLEIRDEVYLPGLTIDYVEGSP